MDIQVNQQPQLVFPAVTICNMSPVKKSAQEASDVVLNANDAPNAATDDSIEGKSRKKRALCQYIVLQKCN